MIARNIGIADASCPCAMKVSRSTKNHTMPPPSTPSDSARPSVSMVLSRVGSPARRARTTATVPTTAPVTKRAAMLLATTAGMSGVIRGEELHSSAPGVGMKATPGASRPARFISTSSPLVLPFSATRQTPIVTSTPTNTACTGV
jgi:hypothetical protein